MVFAACGALKPLSIDNYSGHVKIFKIIYHDS